MIFELGDERLIENPSWQLIHDELRRLNEEDEKVAVLSRSELNYLQAKASSGGGYEMEYQEDSEANHFSTEEKNLDLERVIESFKAYFEGSDAWQKRLRWQRD